MKYVVITPVKNEADFIEKTVASMISQTVKPAEWIIVNDGSTDKTKAIIEAYLPGRNWIRVLDRSDRGFRQLGKGVIESFYYGYEQLAVTDFEFIVKLDGDLSFGPEYFERLIARFDADPKLGIASGACYVHRNDRLIRERNPRANTRGPTKMYRRQTWEQIGGLVTHLGWDTIDELKAQMGGWETRSFRELQVIHHRPTGFAGGALKGRMRQGLGAYYLGYHPLYMVVRAVNRITDRPYILGSAAMLWGFARGYVSREERFEDDLVRRYLRKRQIERLMPWVRLGDR